MDDSGSEDASDVDSDDESRFDGSDYEDYQSIQPTGSSTDVLVLSQERLQWMKWERPPVDRGGYRGINDVIFQQITLDHYFGPSIPGMPGAQGDSVPILRMFGVTMEGNSVCAHVHGFCPYFYVAAPINFSCEECDEFRRQLNAAIRGKDRASNTILDVELCHMSSMYGFHFNRKSLFLKVILARPYMVKDAANQAEELIKELLQSKGATPPKHIVFESNIDFELRFMVDKGIVGCNWIRCPAGKYTLRINNGAMSKCQIELDISWEELISHLPEGEWQKIAPMRILSFDIECAGRKGVFPEPETDPVILIANMVTIQGQSDPLFKNVFTLGNCASIIGSDVICHSTEAELLMAWRRFVQDIDPDIITGYNISDFDLPYLLKRAKILKVEMFPYFGRILQRPTVMKENSASQSNLRLSRRSINIFGRVLFDIKEVLLKDSNCRLRSYSLSSVSDHYLQEQKEELDHSTICDLQDGNEQTRRRLAVYCMKNAILPLRLLDKLMCVINYMEMARVTGVPLGYLLTRGQQIKVVSQLLRKTRKEKLLMPTCKPEPHESYQGGEILPPEKGYYDVPIATLDFASLYPSIMQAHNLCYTTFIMEESHRNPDRLSAHQFIKTKSGDYFVKSSITKGILPQILDDLLSARKKAKDDLKNETDPFKRKVLDGRQLALKMSANSVYGFTGTGNGGMLTCIEISRSVTSIGRQMLKKTRDLIVKHYSRSNGYSDDAKVIYGDTDSVMVHFGRTLTIAEGMRLGKEAAEYITPHFSSPIKLAFEKVYFPYLLIGKKKYAGLLYTHPDGHDRLDCKGLMSVRRDNCPLAANIMTTCLEKIIVQRSPQEAVEYTKKMMADLFTNKHDIHMLIITKRIMNWEGKRKQPHVELAKRMLKYDPGSAPRLGDWVPYIITEGEKKKKLYERSEQPMKVLEKQLPIDKEYYKEMISKPLQSVFKLIPETAKSEIFTKSHISCQQAPCTTIGTGLSKFLVVKKYACLGCKTVLDVNSAAVCSSCQDKKADIYQAEITCHAAFEREFSYLWTQCQRCQGSLHEDILCTSQYCPIFYMRRRVQRDLARQNERVRRFDDDYSW